MTRLASGIDALYLTGAAAIPSDLMELLAAERDRSASLRGSGGTADPVALGAHEFTVGWGGWDNYRFRLDAPGRALIGLVSSGEAFPDIRVQPRAEFLHAVGARGVLAWVYDVVETMGLVVDWKVSRVDLFADFHGLDLFAETRWDFVCKGKRRKTFEDGDDLETLYFGSGKPVLARLYDKTKETAAKGTDWWPDVWGPEYRRGEQVWRVEFEINRAYLKDVGLSSPEEVLDAAGRLWVKLSGEWLTLRVPTEDSNRSRWPVSPVWEVVQAATFGDSAIGHELVRSGQLRGDLRKLTPGAIGFMSSLAALIGARNEAEFREKLPAFVARDERVRGVSFADRVSVKRREYGVA
ncbi:hypothetical protein [Aeromicrobium sp. JJY06]|uniref:hypothetical protein n=1 Tax=Aeromicrobium sp. JJY06 TaxID=3373478 RepID=UPI00376F3571